MLLSELKKNHKNDLIKLVLIYACCFFIGNFLYYHFCRFSDDLIGFVFSFPLTLIGYYIFYKFVRLSPTVSIKDVYQKSPLLLAFFTLFFLSFLSRGIFSVVYHSFFSKKPEFFSMEVDGYGEHISKVRRMKRQRTSKYYTKIWHTINIPSRSGTDTSIDITPREYKKLKEGNTWIEFTKRSGILFNCFCDIRFVKNSSKKE